MLEIILSAVAIVLSVMCSVYVIVKRPAKGEKGDPGKRGPCGPMDMAGKDGTCWVYRINHDMFEVGYYLRTCLGSNYDIRTKNKYFRKCIY